MFFLPEDHNAKVLGLSGKARSGKDYLAKEVVIPTGFIPLALANHFKVSAVSKGYQEKKWWYKFVPPVFLKNDPEPLEIEQMWEKDKDVKTRKALQLEGTEFGRNVYGQDIWCKHAEAWIYYFHLYGYNKFVIPDVRFPNEVKWIQSLGGKVYRVTGRGGLKDGREEHSSEKALDDYKGFDAFIDNSPENEDQVLTELATQLNRDFNGH